MLIANLGCYLCFWLSGYKSEVFTHAFLNSISLLEQLREFRKLLYSLDYHLITKDIKGYESRGRGKDRQGKARKKRMRSFTASSTSLCLYRHVLTNHEALSTLWSFKGDFLMEACWLHHGSWVTQCNLQPLSSPKRWGWDWKCHWQPRCLYWSHHRRFQNTWKPCDCNRHEDQAYVSYDKPQYYTSQKYVYAISWHGFLQKCSVFLYVLPMRGSYGRTVM